MRNSNSYTYIKRLLAFTIFLFVLMPTFCVFADNSAETDKRTVSAGYNENALCAVYAYGDYKISLRNAVYASGGKDDGKMLTDRIYTAAKPLDDDDKTEGWVMIESYDGVSDYRATVTVDIGFYAKDLVKFYLRAFRSTELNAEMPKRIRFYISDNGNDFELLGDGETMTDPSADNSAAVYSLTLNKARNARYFRAVIDCTGGHILWLNEVGAAAYGNTAQVNFGSDDTITDSQGLIYRINGNNAEIIGVESGNSASSGKIAPSKASFNTDGVTYTLGKNSGNEVTVIADFIGEGRPNYSGVPNNIQYIVIHNTGTTEEVTDAERYNLRMHVTDEETSWHYTVDDNKIYHSLADSIVGWHAGSSHNYCSIGIEICTNGAPKRSSGAFVFSGSEYEQWVEERFKKSLRNTAVLVAELLTRYGLSTDAVIQHYDVSEKNCPLWLREKNGKFVHEGTLWVEFMGYVEEYYAMLNGSSPAPAVKAKSDILIPDYIATNDGEVYPVTRICGDAFVDLTDIVSTVTLGNAVSEAERGCFDGTLLEDIRVADGNDSFFAEGGVLYSVGGEVIYDPGEIKSIVPTPSEACKLDIRKLENRYYIYTDGKMTVEDIRRDYGADECIAKDINGYILENGDIPATAAILNLDGARLYVILRGDANGDGVIDQYDYILIKRTYMGTFHPQKRQLYAMTVSGESEVCVYDYILVKRHVLGTYDLSRIH